MTEGPVQINMYGIRYFINGDLSDPYVKKLMVQARNDLYGMKDRNINDIDHIWLNKPKHYKIVSQFGIDSVYINVPKYRKGGLKEKITEKKKKKEYFEEYIIAHEVWIMKNPADVGIANATQIGYLLCMGGGWNPPYKLIEPRIRVNDDGSIIRNVIPPMASYDTWIEAKANGVNVFPFFWNSWKGWNQLDNDFPYGPWGSKPIEQINTEQLLYDDGEYQYWDVPCNLEELVYVYDWFEEDNIEDFDYIPEYDYVERTGWYWDDIVQTWYCFICAVGVLHYTSDCHEIAANQPIRLMITTPGFEYEDENNSISILGTEHLGYDYIIEIIGENDAVRVGEYFCHHSDDINDPPLGQSECEDCTTIQDERDEYDDLAAMGIDYWYATNITNDPENPNHNWRNDQVYYKKGYEYDWYKRQMSPTWGVAKDLDRYAVYYEYEDFKNYTERTQDFYNDYNICHWPINDSGPVKIEEYNWEQGLLIDGKKFILKSENDDDYTFSTRSSDPVHLEELSDGVCIKYFPNNWVVVTIQRYKLSWSQVDALPGEEYPGPEMWCIWVDMNSDDPVLHWDQTFPPPVYDYGVIPDDEDEWWGGIFGNSIHNHFKKIPNAPLYTDSDGVEYSLLTAGQFRLIKKTWEEEKPEKITEREITIIPEY